MSAIFCRCTLILRVIVIWDSNPFIIFHSNRIVCSCYQSFENKSKIGSIDERLKERNMFFESDKKYKQFPTIGCCGIDCGLCPRFYTEGASRCPGCDGKNFETKHPPCGIKSCCADKHGLEVCSQCTEYPCQKYADKEKIERDSFVTHKRIFQNHEYIQTNGIDVFISGQNKRIRILQDMLTNYDDGRCKSFFCLAAALLPVEHLIEAIENASSEIDIKSRAKALRAALHKRADVETIDLSLRK